MKSAKKSAPRGRPFTANDPRRGRGPKKGTGGRTPSEVAAAYRMAFAERLAIATGVADSPTATPLERLKALDLLGKYGGMASVQVTGKDGEELGARGVLMVPTPVTDAEWSKAAAKHQAELTAP